MVRRYLAAQYATCLTNPKPKSLKDTEGEKKKVILWNTGCINGNKALKRF